MGEMRIGAIGKHSNIIQGQVDLRSQTESRRAVRRLPAHGKMLAAEHAGKRARGYGAANSRRLCSSSRARPVS